MIAGPEPLVPISIEDISAIVGVALFIMVLDASILMNVLLGILGRIAEESEELVRIQSLTSIVSVLMVQY